MANLLKQLLQPVAMVWIILIVMCVWQVYRHQYRWAFINGLIIFGLFLFGSTPLSNYLDGQQYKFYRLGLYGWIFVRAKMTTKKLFVVVEGSVPVLFYQ